MLEECLASPSTVEDEISANNAAVRLAEIPKVERRNPRLV